MDGTAAAVVAHLGRPHHVVEGVSAAHSSRSHHTAESTASAPATVTAHSSRSHHAADTASTSGTAVTAHSSSRSHHTTDGAVAHSSRSHHTMDSAAAATAHSSRSHHAQQEKQDEKKPAIAGPSTSRATAMDYREYREKKERERLEREKAAAAIGCHITDPNKHHSHHKPVSNASMPSKHQLPSVQKSTSLHHNHHHRPDIKVGQPVPQRHSASGQPNRDPSRQRLPREHNAGVASTSAGIAHSHSHANLDSSSSESAPHRSDSSAVQDSASSAHSSLEKMSNNHSGHRLNALDSKHQAHDKRLYRGEDPRLKSAKYADMNRIENQRRKVETLEQRCEEVRKLIEKPLPPPKQADIPYLMNAQQKQQAHHAKYNQQQDKGSSFMGDLKHATTINQNALSQGTSPSASSSQKSAPVKTQMYNQHTAQGVSQILKDTIKNGSSQSCLTTLNNMDDTKSEKRSRSTVHEEFAERNSVDVQQGNLHTPPGKHRSLFSPEPPITSKESHAQGARPKSKQKTPPSAATKLKERVSPFASSPTLQDSLLKRSSSNDGAVSAHKRMRTSNISDSEQSVKIKQEIKTEDGGTTSLEAMKMLGRVPDLIQPIRDPLSSNGRNSSASSVINDLKPPELIKPFESDQPRFNTMSQHKVSSMNVNALTNGMDLNVIKQEPPEHCAKREFLEHYIKKEPSGHRVIKQEIPEPTHLQTKLEYTSPMKSAQSISALLQETLAPMPSLLQGLQQSSQLPSQQVHQEQLQHQQQQHQLQSVQHSLMDHQLPATTQCLSIASDNFTPIASTVDISVLSDSVSMTLPSNNSMTEMTVPAASTVTAVPPIEEKRSEHHKSEKKKKKEKHKHKDKEKSKEKHKHKHKDKDKEKHREKKDKEKSEEMPAAAPIKITIPKDKLNLGTEASSTVVGGGPGSSDKNISPQSTGLKIKIPKERLKGTDNVPSSSPMQPPMMQAPLKIKIRTDGMSRSSAAAPPSSSSNGSSGSSHMQLSSESMNETTNRKRERVEMVSDSSGSLPKKQTLMIPATGYGQGHRPGERQNGRHYTSGSNNKVRGRGVRQHHGGRGPPPHHAVAGQRGNAGGHYQREIYGNGRGNRGHQHHQAPYHSHQSHHPPAVRGDVGGYARGTGHADQGTTDPYFYTNYPTMFNASAGYMYDPAYQQYYQQFQQSQYSMYPTGSNLIMTPDGAINTSVPPPSLLSNHLYQNQNVISQSAVSTRQEDLLPPPPLQPPPSPPPLPSGPPPLPPPPPPPSMSE